MARKPNTYSYAIYYKDSSYMIYDLTKSDVEVIEKGLFNRASFVKTSIGMLGLDDVRSLVEQKPVEKPKQNKSGTPDLPVDQLLWLKQQEEEYNKIYGDDEEEGVMQ